MIPGLVISIAQAMPVARSSDTSELIGLILNIGLPLAMITIGWLVGGWRERVHLRDLKRREAEHADVLRTDFRAYGPAESQAGACLVTTEVVIASDYFKAFLAGLRKLIGGNMRSYEILLERARREAILRLVEDARSQNYNALCCIRIEATSVGKGIMPMVAVVAAATAYRASAP